MFAVNGAVSISTTLIMGLCYHVCVYFTLLSSFIPCERGALVGDKIAISAAQPVEGDFEWVGCLAGPSIEPNHRVVLLLQSLNWGNKTHQNTHSVRVSMSLMKIGIWTRSTQNRAGRPTNESKRAMLLHWVSSATRCDTETGTRSHFERSTRNNLDQNSLCSRHQAVAFNVNSFCSKLFFDIDYIFSYIAYPQMYRLPAK